MNNQNPRYPKSRPELKIAPEQEAIIKMYAERVGEKIGGLVSEIVVDSLTPSFDMFSYSNGAK